MNGSAIAKALVLADLGLERNPHAERGLAVWAGIASASALLALFLATRRSGLLARNGSAPPHFSGDDAAPGWPFMRKTIVALAQLLAGMLFILALSRLTTPRPQLPAGWTLICPPHEASALAEQGELLWAGGKEGLFCFDRRTSAPQSIPRLQARDLRGVRALLTEGDSLWIGCRQGLYIYRKETLEALLPPGGHDLGPVDALCFGPSHTLWVGVQGGVWQVNPTPGGQWRWFGAADGLDLPSVDVIYRDHAGDVWFGSNEPESPGLFRADGRTGTFTNEGASLSSHAINGLFTDHTGTLWVGTGFGTRGAAVRRVNGQWVPESGIPEIATLKMYSPFEDSHQRMWFCSEYNGVAILHNGKWTRLTPKEGLPGAEVKTMLEDADGTLWLGTERGLGRIRPGPPLPE